MNDKKLIGASALLGVATVLVYDAVKATYKYAKEKQVGTRVKESLVKMVKKNKENVSDEEEIL